MSNYRALAYHPTSGRLEVADWYDDRTGPATLTHRAHFSDGTACNSGGVSEPDTVDLFLIAQEMAEALRPLAGLRPSPSGRVTSLTTGDIRRANEALAKWRDFTNAKEKTDG